MRLLHRFITNYVTSLRRRNKFFRRFSLGIIFILSTVMVSHFDLSLGVRISSATAVEAKQISFKALVEQGKQYYQAGEFTKAIEKWREAEGVFRSKGDVLNQSAVLSNLALAYQQLGNWSKANLSIENSLKLLNNLSASQVKSLRAEAFNIQGSILISQGKTQQALDSWTEAEKIYQKVNNNAGYIRSLLNKSQALRAMGLYPRAKSSLEQVNKSLLDEPPSLLKAASLLNFGDTLRLMGDLQTSHKVLLESLAIAEKLDSQNDIASASLSLGNNARDRELPEEAFKYYQRAIISATSPIDKVRSQLNQLRLLIDMEKWQEAEDLAAQIKPQIQSLPISRTAIYTKVNFVQS